MADSTFEAVRFGRMTVSGALVVGDSEKLLSSSKREREKFTFFFALSLDPACLFYIGKFKLTFEKGTLFTFRSSAVA